MNSPYRVHPALPSSSAQPSGNTIPFPAGQAKPAPPPTQQKAEVSGKLAKLVKLEGEIRQLKTSAAIVYHAVNDARDLLGFGQAFYFRCNRRQALVLEAVSDVASVDVNAPLVLALTRLVRNVDLKNGLQPLALNSLQGGRFANPYGLVVPLTDQNGKPFGAFLYARAEPWPEADTKICGRVGEAYGHALRVLTPPSLLRTLSLPRWALFGVPLATLLLALVPVPMTALAPFEVVAFEPSIVAAPLDGAIATVVAEPNRPVKTGDILFRFDDTRLKAEADIAAQKVQVAESRLATARNGAFADKELKRSLATTEKELQLAQAEFEFAQTLLQRGVVRAEKNGLLIYASKNDWIGRPVRTGEKVMEIADPDRVAFRIDLAVHDAIALSRESSLRLFLDADPLRPRDGVLMDMSYHAREQPGGGLAYAIRARPMPEEAPLRIGLRGTAQVSGETVSLGFYLLRRPIAALRQYFGR